MDSFPSGPNGQFVSDLNEEMNIAGTDSGSSGGAEMVEDSDVMFLGEYEVDPTADALEILQYLAEENNAQVNMEVTEHDSGHLSQPTTFHCKLEAGSYNVETESSYERIAKLKAAESCLDQMQKDHPTMRFPRWKKSQDLDVNTDPVHLLMQVCRGYRLSAPSHSFQLLKTDEAEGDSQFICRYFWENTFTEGRNPSKAVAQRLAAFEILDFILTKGLLKETKPAVAMDYISVDPETVKKIQDGELTEDALPKYPKPFIVESTPPKGPSEPMLKYRYGFSPRAPGMNENLQIFSQLEGTFIAKGESEADAFQICLDAAMSKARKLREHAVRLVRPTRLSPISEKSFASKSH